MKCIEFKDYILINKWEDLSDKGRSELKEHASQCPECEKLLKQITGLDKLMDDKIVPYQKPFNPKILREKELFARHNRIAKRNSLIWLSLTETTVVLAFFTFGSKMLTLLNSSTSGFQGLISLVKGMSTVSLIAIALVIVSGILIVPLQVMKKYK
ncbi:hypothetical protein KAU32_01370 [bacterium]|nr:hypothetical protein [bacterium]